MNDIVKFNDRVYGQVEINHPPLVRLIQNPWMRRLRGVNQSGWDSTCKITRFTHSVGVMWLVRMFGGDLEEQVAALLHDINHPAFSHAADEAIAGESAKEQAFQDRSIWHFVKQTNLIAELEEIGLDPRRIFEHKRFPRLETELPDICADRIDYALRLGIDRGSIDQAQIKMLLKHLKFTPETGWVFACREAAEQFARFFKGLNDRIMCSAEAAVGHRTYGDYLLHAVRKGYISQEDMTTGTDAAVLSHIAKHHNTDAALRALYARMMLCGNITVRPDWSTAPDCVRLKSRVVDPLFLRDGRFPTRLSEIDQRWARIVDRELKPKQFGIHFH